MEKKQEEEFNNDWSSSPIMNMSVKSQVGIVGTFIGVPALAAMDAMIGLDAWMVLPEAAGIAALLFGATYMMKRRGFDLKTHVKELNWGSLLGDPAESPKEAGSQEDKQEETPAEPEQEIGEDTLFLSSTLRPHANAIFSNRVAILGIPGAGKSNTVAVLSEELGQYGTPLVIFDTENEYKPLCAKPYFKRPYVADKSNVNLEMAFLFGQRIMDERLQVVLNLDSYDDDDLAALIMIDVIKGIQAWEEALSNDDRIPCAIILDEASVWLPQNPKESMLSKQTDENGLTTLDKLQKIFFSVVVRRGRKRGIGFILASQRSAEIDKRAIASAQWKFLQEQNQPSDLSVYKDFGVDKEVAQSLEQGQAFVIGPGVRCVHQLRLRKSPDNAKTPGLESLRKKRYTESLSGRVAQMELPVVPVSSIVESVQVEKPRPTSSIQSQLERTAQKYQKAKEAWENGHTSIRKLMPVMGLNFNQTRDLVDEMHRKGLIDKYEKSRSASENSV